MNQAFKSNRVFVEEKALYNPRGPSKCSFGKYKDLFSQEKGFVMVQKSRGQRARTRYKMQLKRCATPNDFLRPFEVGQTVHVCLQPNIKRQGYSYVQFHGATGRVVEKRGSAYVVQIRDGRAQKQLILAPVHLRAETEKANK